MKFSLIVAIALQATGILAASARTAAEHAALVEECGALGVQEVPEGADPALYRHCAEHPLGSDRRKYKDQSLAPADEIKRAPAANLKAADIFGRKEQACYWDASLGCSGGYCWKSCGNPGEWCWTAQGDGSGPWLQCRSYSDCNSGSACGKGCNGGNSCGCSC